MQVIAPKLILGFGALAALVALWMFPGLVFPAPGANEAQILWNLPFPIVGITLAASLAAVIRSRIRKEPVTGAVALGTYIAGVAAAFVIGLVTVANMGNDRFWPFLLSPIVFGMTGIVLLVTALSTKSASRSDVVAGLVIGVLATILLIFWILARGARDWLLAPYGFDVCLLITLEAGLVFILGGWWRQGRPRAPANSRSHEAAT